jgi:hypothetical protein
VDAAVGAVVGCCCLWAGEEVGGEGTEGGDEGGPGGRVEYVDVLEGGFYCGFDGLVGWRGGAGGLESGFYNMQCYFC